MKFDFVLVRDYSDYSQIKTPCTEHDKLIVLQGQTHFFGVDKPKFETILKVFYSPGKYMCLKEKDTQGKVCCLI